MSQHLRLEKHRKVLPPHHQDYLLDWVSLRAQLPQPKCLKQKSLSSLALPSPLLNFQVYSLVLASVVQLLKKLPRKKIRTNLLIFSASLIWWPHLRRMPINLGVAINFKIHTHRVKPVRTNNKWHHLGYQVEWYHPNKQMLLGFLVVLVPQKVGKSRRLQSQGLQMRPLLLISWQELVSKLLLLKIRHLKCKW